MSISLGNTKLGNIPNIPLPPIKSCHNCSECSKLCYAIKSYRQYPDTKKSWDANLLLWLTAPAEYERMICNFLSRNKPKNFRWHVGGDIQGQLYLDMMIRIAKQFPETNFLCFTKYYELNFDYITSNLNVIFSTWPGMTLPKRKKNIKWTWIAHDPRTPQDVVKCSGHCDSCLYCFNSKNKTDVVMKIH